jgi:hypothetical protein
MNIFPANRFQLFSKCIYKYIYIHIYIYTYIYTVCIYIYVFCTMLMTNREVAGFTFITQQQLLSCLAAF